MSKMKIFFIPIACFIILASVLILSSGHIYGCENLEDCEIIINMAPQYITLQGKGNIVLHTYMDYDAVDKNTVCLSVNDIDIDGDFLSFREDDLGYLDVHFPKVAIIEALELEDVRGVFTFIFTLVGDTNDSVTFCGSQAITLPPFSNKK